MIGWLCSKIVKAGRRYNSRDEEVCVSIEDSIHSIGSNSIDMDNALRLAVLPAQGGCVLEVRQLDRKTHNWNNVAHIIPEGEDVAHRVGQIVAMELLRR